MKNILHIIDSLGRGGAETLLVNTIKDFPEYKHYVCYLGGADDFEEELSKYAKVRSLHFSSKIQILNVYIKLKNLIIKNNINIIHSHLLTSTHFARLSHGKVPLISTVHNILSEDSFSANRFSLPLEKLLYSPNDVTVFVSNCAMEDYQLQNPALNVTNSFVFHNYVHQDFITNSYTNNFDSTKGLRLIAVGNLRKQKNYSLIIDAFKLLKDLPITLDIYGDGDLKEQLQSEIDKHSLKVNLKGRTNNVLSQLNNYDAYLMGSLYEGCPIAPMEAMCFGMPLVLSEIGPLREIAQDRALYFDPQQTESIAKTVRAAYFEWDNFIELSCDNKIWASARYSKEIYLNKLRKLYNTI